MKHLIIIPIICLLVSCGGDSINELDTNLREAEAAVAQGDMKVAASLSEYLMGNENLSQLSASQLARLSIVYMQMADHSDEGINTATATDLYRRAYNAAPDSAASYYSSVPFDKMQYVDMLQTLTKNIGSKQPTIEEITEFAVDSLPETVNPQSDIQ